MKRFLIALFSLVLCTALCACSSNHVQDTSEKSDAAPSAEQTEPETTEVVYPFDDGEGRTHYRIYINGELTQTDHDAYSYPEEPNGAYYPIAEILSQLGVDCLFDEQLGTLTTRVNGSIVTCKTDSSDIVIGNTTLGGTAPEYIDGCFYVPSYTFMQLLDAVVDFTPDRSGVTITTDTKIDPEQSGTDGLSISPETSASLGDQKYSGAQACPTCGGRGRAICTSCSGTGGVTQYIQARDPVSGQYTITGSRAFCSRCGGSGFSTCPTCGGSGKR